MSGLGKIVADLSRYRRLTHTLMPPLRPEAAPRALTTLVDVADFGPNPGNLLMRIHVPARHDRQAALVVVLHGCTQTALDYDRGSGWSRLADLEGFALLFPEQQAQNNPNTCFNWFEPRHATRDSGEAASIRQMIEHMIITYGLDRSRVFITGLSAGGAMTSVMLAAYPEVFAAGAIIAGLPFGTARNVPEAYRSMMAGVSKPAGEWASLVREASVRDGASHGGAWPNVSIWHGEHDQVVAPANARELVKQWTQVHGLPLHDEIVTDAEGRRLRQWRDAHGVVRVEEHVIAGMQHGTPVAGDDDTPGAGVPERFMLDVGIASTIEIARFWGLGNIAALPELRRATRSATPNNGPRDWLAACARPLRALMGKAGRLP
jgi:feruloyl esterase